VNNRFLILFLVTLLIIVIAVVVILGVLFGVGIHRSPAAAATPASSGAAVTVHNHTATAIDVQDWTGALR
jgi:uncharacterized protein (UPF0333 family)